MTEFDFGTRERALLMALIEAWTAVNVMLFGRGLRQPIMQLHETSAKLGYYEASTRTLSLQHAFAFESSWGTVVEVLKHEMAHQFVFEVLGVMDETAHGPAFQAVCRERGIDASARGLPEAPEVDEDAASVRRRIAKLLALAGSPNPHEAATAAAMASKLRLKHRIESQPSSYSWKELGTIQPRLSEVDRLLSALVQQHAFVKSIFVTSYDAKAMRKGRVLQVCGSPEDLEFAEWVYAFVRRTAETMADQHVYERGGGRRTVYMAGVISGILETLNRGVKSEASETTALVWKGDKALDDYYERRFPSRSKLRGRTSAHNDEHLAGRAAGRKVVLHRPIRSDSAAGGGFLGP